MKPRELLLFVLCALLVCLAIYRSAFWGERILAPLDIGPDVFEYYKFMDPDADGVPKNHYIVDQFTYDLPLQYGIYKSIRAGEIPWWDPYTCGGRPLLADAHINGTDPVRLLCYLLLPFELAYNWNLILHGILAGLGMFVLLRYLQIQLAYALILAIGYQFGGWFTMHFGHPWIQASMLYYPFLWVVWLRGLERSLPRAIGWGGLMCALVFYCGNLQSHSYLIIFSTFFLGAILWRERSAARRALFMVICSGVLGALAALPVLTNQLEFFMLGARAVTAKVPWWMNLAGFPMSAASIYPWMLGSFRTLDLCKVFGAGGAPYCLLIGPCVSLLALWQALTCKDQRGPNTMATAMGLLLVLGYVLICSTPLVNVFYTRCAPLAGMGIVVLAGLGLQRITAGIIPKRWTLVLIISIFALASLGSSLLAWFVYPAVRTRVEEQVLKKDQENTTFITAPALRRFQVANLPREISLQNPEALLAVASLLLMAGFIHAKGIITGSRTAALLAFCISPAILFHMRFSPSHSTLLWRRMLQGGPIQKEAMAMVGAHERLMEMAQNGTGTSSGKMVFPNALSALWGVHVVHGYSALVPISLFRYPHNATPPPKGWHADVCYENQADAHRFFSIEQPSGSARFQPLEPRTKRSLNIVRETQNTLTLRIAPGEPFSMIRTDTYYPGWRAVFEYKPVAMSLFGACFTRVDVPASERPGEIVFTYAPCHLRAASIAGGIGVLVIGWLFVSRRFSKGSEALIEERVQRPQPLQ